MGRKLGGLCSFEEGNLGPHLTQCGQAEAYLHAKFHLDASNRLATIHQRHRQDRQDRQRSDSIGRTVLQTVVQKWDTVDKLNITPVTWTSASQSWLTRIWRLEDHKSAGIHRLSACPCTAAEQHGQAVRHGHCNVMVDMPLNKQNVTLTV